jgi:very-short-patch-repair endonuclease
MNLSDRILDELRLRPGQRASELARTFDVARRDINALLHGPLAAVVVKDDDHRWRVSPAYGGGGGNRGTFGVGVAGPPEDDNSRSTGPGEAGPPQSQNLFARLCSYYLRCIAFDLESDVSLFATSRFDDLDYLELTGPTLRLESAAVESHPRLGRGARARSTTNSLFLGYPTRLRRVRSRRTRWQGLLVEPVLLFALGRDDSGALEISDGPPIINPAVVRTLDAPQGGRVIDAVLELQRDLGLLATEVLPSDPRELVRMLRTQRSGWDWVEDIDPDHLSSGTPLSGLEGEGIYNRAVVVRLELPPYTRGLDAELTRLIATAHLQPAGTALSAWVSGDSRTSASAPKDALEQPLLEPLPLNTEQRLAVRRGLTQPLTIVTGPPGTGKSQVVTSLLVNAAFQGKRVLFASKNNKAVDVVETRVNALAPRPVLLRLGSNQYRTRLADLLTSFLAAAGSSEEDALTLRMAEERHATLTRELTRIERDQERFLEARNTLDRSDRLVDSVRHEYGEDRLRQLANVDLNGPSIALTKAHQGWIRSDRSGLAFATRLIWPLIRRRRLRDFTISLEACAEAFRALGLDTSNVAAGPHLDLGAAKAFLEDAARRLEMARVTRTYFQAIAELGSVPSIETLASDHLDLTHRMAANSEGLWRSWVSVQPSTLSQRDRLDLQEFLSALRLTLQADEDDAAVDASIRRRVRELYPKVTRTLPCWAITSLSAHGRLPLEPAFFDLVVIDEASQCDIASALPLLHRAMSAVIIGDPQQLRHISSVPRSRDAQLLEQHGLVEDGLRWSYSTNSLYDLATSMAEPETLIQLRDHHRSHADIIEFSNDHFYDGQLRVATRYERLVLPPRDQAIVKWINLQGTVQRPPAGGAVNEEEAVAVVRTLRELLFVLDYRGELGVVSPFRAQANRIQELASADEELFARLANRNFLVNTVHAFQGDERDLMLFSPVVSLGTPQGALGFLRSNRNLFNVAITRARGALWVVGDLRAALDTDVDYLSAFARYVQQVGAERSDREPVPAHPDLGDEYPPVRNPESVSDWERHFYRALRSIGARPIPQYQVENYALDFALFVGRRKLNIEVDGARYHMDWTGELCRRDMIRNQRLIEQGWEVKRFWVSQIRDDLDGCLQWVARWMRNAEDARDAEDEA